VPHVEVVGGPAASRRVGELEHVLAGKLFAEGSDWQSTQDRAKPITIRSDIELVGHRAAPPQKKCLLAFACG